MGLKNLIGQVNVGLTFCPHPFVVCVTNVTIKTKFLLLFLSDFVQKPKQHSIKIPGKSFAHFPYILESN